MDVWCNILHLFFFTFTFHRLPYLQHYSTHQTSARIRYRSSTIHLPARASFCRAITRLTRETLHYTPHFRFGCFRGPFANRICCIVNRCDRANSTNWAFPWKPPSAAWLAVLLRVTMATLVGTSFHHSHAARLWVVAINPHPPHHSCHSAHSAQCSMYLNSWVTSRASYHHPSIFAKLRFAICSAQSLYQRKVYGEKLLNKQKGTKSLATKSNNLRT